MHSNNHRARGRMLALLVAASLALGGTALAAGETALVGTVNVNTATSEQLQLLPGIGEARAREVIALRKKRGGLKSVDELTQVKGIGAVALERLRPFARTDGKTTARIE